MFSIVDTNSEALRRTIIARLRKFSPASIRTLMDRVTRILIRIMEGTVVDSTTIPREIDKIMF